jgi:hypothetical protein
LIDSNCTTRDVAERAVLRTDTGAVPPSPSIAPDDVHEFEGAGMPAPGVRAARQSAPQEYAAPQLRADSALEMWEYGAVSDEEVDDESGASPRWRQRWECGGSGCICERRACAATTTYTAFCLQVSCPTAWMTASRSIPSQRLTTPCRLRAPNRLAPMQPRDLESSLRSQSLVRKW